MADSPPRNRVARSAKVGGLVAGQSARWAGTRAANRLRSPEDADAATGERAAALARELVKQLGQLRGAAMKVGQVLSTVDFTAIPESEREEFKATLAALRDDVPPLPFKKVRKLLEEELGGKVGDHFETFEEEAFAAASIGQVHRAVTLDGDEVAVKLQYPGVAEAVESDLRNLSLLLPLVKRLAPGLDVKALYGELRERIAEELDYEIEAQNHRAVGARLPRPPGRLRAEGPHRALEPPRARHRPAPRPPLRAGQGARRRRARPLRRDRLPLLLLAAAADGPRVRRPASRQLPAARRRPRRLPRLRADAQARRRSTSRASGRWRARCVAEDADEVHAILSRLGYLPDPDDFVPEALLEWLLAAGEWYLQPGWRRLSPQYVTELLDATASPRSPWFEQQRRMTIPPQALLMRRMEGLIFATLGELRAGGDWHELAKEFFADEPTAV